VITIDRVESAGVLFEFNEANLGQLTILLSLTQQSVVNRLAECSGEATGVLISIFRRRARNKNLQYKNNKTDNIIEMIPSSWSGEIMVIK